MTSFRKKHIIYIYIYYFQITVSLVGEANSYGQLTLASPVLQSALVVEKMNQKTFLFAFLFVFFLFYFLLPFSKLTRFNCVVVHFMTWSQQLLNEDKDAIACTSNCGQFHGAVRHRCTHFFFILFSFQGNKKKAASYQAHPQPAYISDRSKSHLNLPVYIFSFICKQNWKLEKVHSQTLGSWPIYSKYMV